MIEYWILEAVPGNTAIFMAWKGPMTKELLMRGYKKPFVTSDLYPDHQTDDRMKLFCPNPHTHPFSFNTRKCDYS